MPGRSAYFIHEMGHLPGCRDQRSRSGTVSRARRGHGGHARYQSTEVANARHSSGAWYADFTLIKKEGETIVVVPLKAMLTVDCIPSSFADKFVDGISVHGLIAAFLTHGDQKTLEKYELWRRVWPSRQDFENRMPILWSERPQDKPPLQTLLPPSISGQWSSIRKKTVEHEYDTKHQNLLAQQKKRLQEAWDSVRAAFPDTDWETFSYYWLIVNTRSFFYLQPDQDPPEDRNDAMALVPFADYFNHADEAVSRTSFVFGSSVF